MPSQKNIDTVGVATEKFEKSKGRLFKTRFKVSNFKSLKLWNLEL